MIRPEVLEEPRRRTKSCGVLLLSVFHACPERVYGWDGSLQCQFGHAGSGVVQAKGEFDDTLTVHSFSDVVGSAGPAAEQQESTAATAE